jgi:hypothetical protein
VQGMSSFWPFVEVNARLHERNETEDKAVELDQSPVPAKGLIWTRERMTFESVRTLLRGLTVEKCKGKSVL